MIFDISSSTCIQIRNNKHFPIEIKISSESEMRKAARYDHVGALLKDGTRLTECFCSSNVIIMDCDNDYSDNEAEWITAESIDEILPDVNYVIVYSRHHMKSKGMRSARQRFHVYFPIEQCTDQKIYCRMKRKIHKRFPFFDKGALDAVRLIFGADGDVIWHEGTIDIDEWLQITNNIEPIIQVQLTDTTLQQDGCIPEKTRNTTMYGIAKNIIKKQGVSEQSCELFYKEAERCVPPLDKKELDCIWRSAKKRVQPDDSSTDTSITYHSFADIPDTEVEWIWYPYIPCGKIVILTSAPGVGKTFLSLFIVSAISNGSPFMGEDASNFRHPEIVFYQSAEDGIGDTLKRRLKMMNPPPILENIINVDESENPIVLSDKNKIERILIEKSPSLMVFDPIQAYIGSKVNCNSANEVRAIMAQICRLAETYKCTFLFIMHNSKMQQRSAMNAALGSIDFSAISRSALILDKNPKNQDQLILCHTKSSLAKTGKSIVYQIENGTPVYKGFSNLTADDVYLSNAARNKNTEKKNEAKVILNALLSRANGAVDLDEVKTFADLNSISMQTFHRARIELNLQRISSGFNNKKTYWASPDMDPIVLKQMLIKDMAKEIPDTE